MYSCVYVDLYPWDLGLEALGQPAINGTKESHYADNRLFRALPPLKALSEMGGMLFS